MLWLGLLVVSCLAALSNGGPVTKSGSGYSGVTIAIHKDVPENPALIESIKRQFTAASEALHRATTGWAYFKDIVIAIPDTWKGTVASSKVYKDPYPTSEFRIAKANGAYGDRPYTLQPGGCGEAGEYVHLTPDFFLKSSSHIEDVYGPIDRVLVHEWSHLRYGIFDEYGISGDPTFPLFYFDDGFMKINLCPEGVKGWMESDDGPICTVYNDQVTKDCAFIPDLTDQSIKATLMSLHYLPNVNRFCTKENAMDGAHNWQAPNKQNLVCQRRSSWEVVSNHPDFAGHKTEVPFVAPSFRVVTVEHLPPRYVFVLDISGSMQGQPLVLMKQATDRFARDLVKDGSYVGAVLFEASARTLQPVVQVNSGTRLTISRNLQSIQANGGTSIGSGMLEAVNALKRAGQPTEDAVLIVISDGEENSAPNIQSAMPTMLAAKVKIMAVAFGSKASLDLEGSARQTGGQSIFFKDIQGTSTAGLDQFFMTAITEQADTDVQFFQLLNKPFQLANALTQTTVTLDSDLGKNVVFSLSGSVDQVDMDLESPSGKHYVISDSAFTRSVGRIQYKLATAEPGVWKVNIRKKAGGVITVDLGLVAEPKNAKVEPIKAEAFMEKGKASAAKGVKLYALVSKGGSAVIRAEVKAVVVSDTNVKSEVILNDNGSGVDSVKDDGTYSGIFTNFQPNAKRYSVTAFVTNRGKAYLKSASHSPSAIILNRKPRVPPKSPATNRFKLSEFQKLDEDPYRDEPIGEKADDFDRTANGDNFIVDDGNRILKDEIKPSPVNDLAVVETEENSKGQKLIHLTWTSPGDNMDTGTPAKLEVRLSLNGLVLVRNFSSGFLVDSSHVHVGDLNPRSGGQLHEVTLIVPNEILQNTASNKPLDIYIAVRATDKAGNIGDLGRIAVAHFGYELPICIQPTGMFPRARHCNQFYHCSNGEPYVKDCPGELHFSVQGMRCEWPCSAKCDTKIKCGNTP